MNTFDIGVDLDGVGYNLQAALAPFARRRGFPLASEERWNTFNTETGEHGGFASWGVPDYESFLALCADAVEEGTLYATGAPFSGFISMMKALAEDGHRLHIITARTTDPESRAAQATRAWLAEWAIPYSALSFARDKTKYRTDFFIEDTTYNYTALLETGMTVPYLISRPWNLTFEAAYRVGDLDGFVTEVRKAANPASKVSPGTREMLFLEPQRG